MGHVSSVEIIKGQSGREGWNKGKQDSDGHGLRELRSMGRNKIFVID
jgi:hypothetical protein